MSSAPTASPLALFGGTFDPVHFGHLRVAQDAATALCLPELRFVPAQQNVLRDRPGASAHDRLAMLRLAVCGQPGLTVDNCELLRATPSYTITTLESFREQFPQRSLIWLVGVDAFLRIQSWYRASELFDFAHFVVLNRPGFCDGERVFRGDERCVAGGGRPATRRSCTPSSRGASICTPLHPRRSLPPKFATKYATVRRMMRSRRCFRRLCCPIFGRIGFTSTISKFAIGFAKCSLRNNLRLNKIQQAAVTALEDIKATDITPLDTRTLTSLYDAIIIGTAESARQTKALARNVADKVKAAGGYINSIEGEGSGEWVIVDCGELVVHIMLPHTRVLYHLEELWTPAPSVPRVRSSKTLEKKPVVSAVKPPSTKATTEKVQTSSTRKPAAKAPAAKKPAAKKPATRRTSAKAPAGKAPAAKKPTAKPSAKKPAVKRPAAKKPTAKKPAAKKRGAK